MLVRADPQLMLLRCLEAIFGDVAEWSWQIFGYVAEWSWQTDHEISCVWTGIGDVAWWSWLVSSKWSPGLCPGHSAQHPSVMSLMVSTWPSGMDWRPFCRSTSLFGPQSTSLDGLETIGDIAEGGWALCPQHSLETTLTRPGLGLW